MYSDEVLEFLEEYLIVMSISVCRALRNLSPHWLSKRSQVRQRLPTSPSMAPGSSPTPLQLFIMYHPSWSYPEQGACFIHPAHGFLPQNNILCHHHTSAWLPCYSSSWVYHLQTDFAAAVLEILQVLASRAWKRHFSVSVRRDCWSALIVFDLVWPQAPALPRVTPWHWDTPSHIREPAER